MKNRTKTDFKYYCDLEMWTIDQTAFALVGQNPSTDYSGNVVWSKESLRMKELLEMGVRLDLLKCQDEDERFVLPSSALKWAEAKKLPIPVELKHLLNEIPKYLNLLNEEDSLDLEHRSTYWCQLKRLVEGAIEQYPDWRGKQKKVQKTGNLKDWIHEELKASTRETEIVIKVLTDYFPNL